VPAGDPVFPILGAANHDPDRYVDPDRLDVTRTEIRPLTFGGGLHFCLGAALARAETEIVFRKLLERFATIELAGEAPYRDRLTLRGPSEVPISVSEHARATSAAGVGMLPPKRAASVSHTSHASKETVSAASASDADRSVGAEGEVMAARPRGDDSAWRTEYRTRLETGSKRNIGELAPVVALLGRVPFFAGCTTNELEGLASTAYPISFEAGEELCTEGSVSLECYVIAEGEASVVIDGAIVATVVADDVVGERGALLDAPRNATVTARTHMLTYAISRDRLKRLVDDSPTAKAGFEEAIRRRFAPADA
jgi:hypothetical protein